MKSQDLPRAFIGCSSESLDVAESIMPNLENWCYPELWSHSFFILSKTNIENLEHNLPKFDFAIFLLTPDDVSIIRKEKIHTPRDNLIFEVGMAIGIFGRPKTFLILPKNCNLRLPTDILGVTYAEYNQDHPNNEAALSTACKKVRQAIDNAPFFKPVEQIHSLFEKTIANIHQHHIGDAVKLVEHVNKVLFHKNVIRRHWVIDLSYDFSKISDEIIIERIIWDYEFINISIGSIEYPMSLFSFDGDQNTLISFTHMGEDGNPVPVFQCKNGQLNKQGIFKRQQSKVRLEPNIPYFIKMKFLLEHSVSPKTHYIHNSFAPLDPTLSARVKAIIPSGYRMDVLANDVVHPDKLDDHWDFIIRGPLLPEQIIEYVFQKDNDENRK